MTVKMTETTIKHTELLGVFIRELQGAKQSFINLAKSYKACVEAGMDMSADAVRHLGVSEPMLLRLSRLAEGRLIEDSVHRLPLMCDDAVEILAGLPADKQRMLLEDGVEIWRKLQIQKKRIELVRASEARRIVDATGGAMRLLSGEEQAARAAPVARRRDKIAKLRFTAEQWTHAERMAHKAGWSVQKWLMTELLLNGSLGPKTSFGKANGQVKKGEQRPEA